MAANDEIRDQLLAHQVQLLRFGKGMASRIKRILNRAEPELRRVIRERLDRIARLGWDPGPATTKRMIKTAKQIAATNKPTFDEINKLITSELLSLSVSETQFVAEVISSSLPVVFDLALPSARDLRRIVLARPFNNRILRDWTKSFEVGDRRRMMDEIRQGLVFSETPTQIGRRIFGTAVLGGVDGTREITRRGAQTLAQTATSAITNAARQVTYLRNRKVINREQYVATLDSRTTPICRSLDGDIFEVGKGPIPPVHINCRSLRVPVINGKKLGNRPAVTATKKQLQGLKGSDRRSAVAKMVGQEPAATTYQKWLGRQNVSFQNEVLGPTRGKLFRSGELDLKGFVDNSGKQFTLRELYNQDPATFQRANIKAPRKAGAPVPKL